VPLDEAGQRARYAPPMAARPASVVVPAYNEADHIERLLHSLADAANSIPLQVIVVCNGCTDATESIARSFKDVEVVVSDQAAKHVALNMGDNIAGDAFPRLYADADVLIEADSVHRLIEALSCDQVRAVGPRVVYDLARCPWMVQAYIRTAERLPFNEFWHSSHLQGRGVYGTNRAGRSKFDRFPALRSDDGFFDLMFDEVERVVVDDAVVRIACPDTTAALLRNQTRVIAGYDELIAWMEVHHPERQSVFLGEQGKGWKDLHLWLQSRFARELVNGTAATDAVGYASIECLSRANSLLHRTLGRQINWR